MIQGFATNHFLWITSLDRYLSYLWNPGDGTPARVRKLCLARVWITRGVIPEHFNWYRLPVFHQRAYSPKYISEAQAIRSTEEYLRQAVHRQLVADVPVGAFHLVVWIQQVIAFARERNPDLRCFTIDVRGTRDEGLAMIFLCASCSRSSWGVFRCRSGRFHAYGRWH